MPHWIIYHPPNAFQDVEAKRALVKDVTSLYNMPPFYVTIDFVKQDPSDHWIGGQMSHERSTKPFIRIQITHIHVRLPNEDEVYKNLVARWDAALKPHLLDKGYDYEFHIAETDRRLWSINGLAPPAWKSEDEELWRKAGRPLSEDEMEVQRKKA